MDFTIKEYINNDDGIIQILLDFLPYENIHVKVFNIFEQFSVSTADALITFPDQTSYRFYKQYFGKIEDISREMLLESILKDISFVVEERTANVSEEPIDS
jgi:hypothetical protein